MMGAEEGGLGRTCQTLQASSWASMAARIGSAWKGTCSMVRRACGVVAIAGCSGARDRQGMEGGVGPFWAPIRPAAGAPARSSNCCTQDALARLVQRSHREVMGAGVRVQAVRIELR